MTKDWIVFLVFIGAFIWLLGYLGYALLLDASSSHVYTEVSVELESSTNQSRESSHPTPVTQNVIVPKKIPSSNTSHSTIIEEDTEEDNGVSLDAKISNSSQHQAPEYTPPIVHDSDPDSVNPEAENYYQIVYNFYLQWWEEMAQDTVHNLRESYSRYGNDLELQSIRSVAENLQN